MMMLKVAIIMIVSSHCDVTTTSISILSIIVATVVHWLLSFEGHWLVVGRE